VRTFSIDGSIQMKSYLSGSPELHLALNDDLAIASAGKGGYGMVELDNVNFHECVQLDKFDSERMLVLEPPHGEFVLMNFHIGSLRSDSQIPFRITPIMMAVTEYKQELRLQVCDPPPFMLEAGDPCRHSRGAACAFFAVCGSRALHCRS
jgi:AP-4 complex subunit mu-1